VLCWDSVSVFGSITLARRFHLTSAAALSNEWGPLPCVYMRTSRRPMSSVVRSISRVDDAPTPAHSQAREFTVAVLTGGGDRAYALGVAECLIAEGLYFDCIGSDELESEDLERSPQVRVLNLRGDMSSDASLAWKACRVLVYYARLIKYAATAE